MTTLTPPGATACPTGRMARRRSDPDWSLHRAAPRGTVGAPTGVSVIRMRAIATVVGVTALILTGCGTTKAGGNDSRSASTPVVSSSAVPPQAGPSPAVPSPAASSPWGPWITARADLDSTPSSGAPDCPSYRYVESLAPQATTRIPTSFRADAVIVCSSDQRTVAGRLWGYVTEREATSGVDDFVRVLRSRDAARTSDLCSTVGVTVPYILLRSRDGSVIWPRLPQDHCAFVLDRVYGALDALKLRTVSERRDTPTYAGDQIRADAAGCEADDGDSFYDWSDIDGPPSMSGNLVITSSHKFPACRYRVSPEDPTQGIFDSGRRQTRAQSMAMLALLNRSTPAKPCQVKPTRSAKLFDNSGDVQVLVELDGCHRVFDLNSNTMGQATPELLAALA